MSKKPPKNSIKRFRNKTDICAGNEKVLLPGVEFGIRPPTDACVFSFIHLIIKNMITIKFEKGEHNFNEYRVYQKKKLVGTVRKFCCGIDFRIKGKPNALFSIMPARSYKDTGLKESIEAILQMKIPKRNFHWNFNQKLLDDKEKLKEYELHLLNPKQK